MKDSFLDLDILASGYPALRLFSEYPTDFVYETLLKIRKWELKNRFPERLTPYQKQAQEIFTPRRLEILNDDFVVDQWIEYMSIERQIDMALVLLKIKDRDFIDNCIEIKSDEPPDEIFGHSNILVTPHLGAYQAIPQLLCHFDYRLTALMCANAVPMWINLMPYFSSDSKYKLLGLPSLSAPRTAIKELRDGSNLLLYPEFSLTSSHKSETTIQFLNETIYEIVGPARFAQITERPIVPIYIMRHHNFHYTLYVGQRLFVGPSARDVFHATNIITKWLENLIKQNPSQWWGWTIFENEMVVRQTSDCGE